jgi:hypothetical protein
MYLPRYKEWHGAHFFPEIVYSDARTEWIKNMPFNKCFVQAKKGSMSKNVERGDDYCLTSNFSALCCGEYKMVLTATSDDDLVQRTTTLRLPAPLQSLSPSERDAQLPDAQARLR